jgi:hypothetical protein
MVTVRTRLPEADAASATLHADLEIQFAGQTAQYNTGSIPTGEARKRDPNLRNNSGNTI